jgi:hypothetical protein
MSEMRVSRRKFLTGSAATAAGAAVATSGISLLSERAEAFFNMGAFWKKPVGSGQTSNGYTIGQSLRFNGSADANLYRTFGSSNRNAWTFSCWYKRAKTGNTTYNIDVVFSPTDGGTVGNREQLNVSNDAISYVAANASYSVVSSQLLRDPSAYYHLVWSVDLTQATAANRVRMFVNGVQVTAFSTASYPPQNWTGAMTNTAIAHYIGIAPYNPTGNGRAADGVISEVYFIDGQALDATSFGTTDTISGQWIPKGYSGAYGTNGFYLKFADNSNTTAATLGKDSSGNDNNWTPSGFATHDQVLDSPTNNFCCINPMAPSVSTALSAGNLVSTTTGSIGVYSGGTIGFGASEKYYWEVLVNSTSAASGGNGSAIRIGIKDAETADTYDYVSIYAGGTYYLGQKYSPAGFQAYTTTFAANDVVSVVWDGSTQTLTFWVNGSSKSAAFTGLTLKFIQPSISMNNYAGDKVTFNFGQGGQTGLTYDAASGGRFKYTPPAGFKALSTANLPAPTIKKPNQHFTPLLYTGDGVDGRSVTGLSFQPDLVWIKSRVNAYDHRISDSVRGGGKYLTSNQTYDEATCQSGVVGSFLSDGFTLTKNAGSVAGVNDSNGTNNYVAWCWKKGTIPGFDIVTQNSIAGSATIAHGLGVAPSFIFGKSRTNAYSWWMYHKSMGATQSINCPSTNAALTRTTWQNLAPTASQFYVGNSDFDGNAVFYLWAEVAGFSKFGSYTGNGSADGPFIYCGFKPAFILIKRSDGGAYNWSIHDNKRSGYNTENNDLFANLSNAENSYPTPQMDLLSNGFKLRAADAAHALNELNTSSATYIFAAFAEAPFKYATAR